MAVNAQNSTKNEVALKLSQGASKQPVKAFFKRLLSPKGIAMITAVLLVGMLPFLEKIPNDEKQAEEPVPERKTLKQDAEKIPQPLNSANEAKQANSKKFKCESDESGTYYFICKFKESRVLAPVQNIGVVIAAIIYIFETGQRKKQQHRQAWQVIDAARHVETSGARKQALEELAENGESLSGLDADGSDLIEINLQGADLINAHLNRANLKKAQLQNTNLYGAKLDEADLRGANLECAILKNAQLNRVNQSLEDVTLQGKENAINLKNADLGHASLQGANLEYAVLEGANLSATNLQYASLRHTKLKGVDFMGANLEGARFACASGLTLEQIEKAINWKEAKYDRVFCQLHPDKELQEDDGSDYTHLISNSQSLDLPIELKLLSCIQSIMIAKEKSRQRELDEIREKVAELLLLLENQPFSSLQESLQTNELIDAVKNLAYTEKNPVEAATLSSNIIRFQQEIKRVPFLTTESENSEREDKKEEAPYVEAGNWLLDQIEMISNRAVQEYQRRNLQNSSNIQALHSGIAECLKLIGTYLLEVKTPLHKDLQSDWLNRSTKLEMLQLILEQVIPHILTESHLKISDEAYLCLQWSLEQSISALRKEHFEQSEQ